MALREFISFSLLLLSPLEVAAQENPFATDFGMIFNESAGAVGRVEKEDGTVEETLTLPGPVLLTRNTDADGTSEVTAIDQSGLGAVGCSLRVQVDLAKLVRHCEGFGAEKTNDDLRALRLPILEFYATNNVPSRPVGTLEAAVESIILAASDELTLAQCETSVTDDAQLLLDLMVLPGMNQEVARVLSQPRLPVSDPCF